MAPIASAQTIPDDILYEIFREFVRVWDQDVATMPTQSDSYHSRASPIQRHGGWVSSLTHVCRRWRTVAFNACALWTNVIFGVPGGTFAFLERARAAPLRITGEVSDDTNDELILRTLGAVLDRSEQIVAFDLRLPAIEPPVFTALGPRLFPNVVSLSLARGYGGPVGDEVTLPKFFDSRLNAVPLKELRLKNYPITAGVLHGALSLCNITTFELKARGSPRMGLTLNVLKNMPRLEKLSLSGVDRPAEWVDEHYRGMVPLLRLRQLSVYSMAWGAATLLKHLHIPSVTSVKLNLISDTINAHGTPIFNPELPAISAAIVDALFPETTRGAFPTITALAIRSSEWGIKDSHIRGWTIPSPLEILPVSDAQLLDENTVATSEAAFDLRLSGFTGAAIIQHLCSLLPLEHAQILFISYCKRSPEYERRLTRQNWQDLLVRMPALHTLSATSGAIMPLPTLLRPETDAEGTIQIPFPHLRRLIIRRYEALRTHEPHPSWMEELTESLLRRAQSGGEIDFDFGWLVGDWVCF